MADLDAVIYRIAEGEEAGGKEERYSPRYARLSEIFFFFFFFILSEESSFARAVGERNERNETESALDEKLKRRGKPQTRETRGSFVRLVTSYRSHVDNPT